MLSRFVLQTPQAPKFKAWLKSHLAKGRAIVWFPLCKGDPHRAYPGSAPNGGQCDHVEPMLGLWSNHPLNDTTVYDDDVILHFSDQDTMPYYRPMSTLEDTTSMEGNCKNAVPGFGHNEMYPCFDSYVTYGLAVTGLKVNGTVPVSLAVDITREPDVRERMQPTDIHGTATVRGLTSGATYTLYRYASTADVPSSAPFGAKAEASHTFVASGENYVYADPKAFSSHSATYYVAAPGKSDA